MSANPTICSPIAERLSEATANVLISARVVRCHLETVIEPRLPAEPQALSQNMRDAIKSGDIFNESLLRDLANLLAGIDAAIEAGTSEVLVEETGSLIAGTAPPRKEKRLSPDADRLLTARPLVADFIGQLGLANDTIAAARAIHRLLGR